MTSPALNASSGAEPSRLRLMLYALPAFPMALMMLPFFVIVPEFYSREVGLSLSVVGAALLVVRLIDAISDPLIGWWCDRTRPHYGRRRLWLAMSAPLVAMSTALVFMPPTQAGVSYLLITGIVLSLSFTAFQVPYLAWGAELSPSYHGRTRVAAFREGITVAGTLIALIIPALTTAWGATDNRTAMMFYALIVGIALPLFVVLLVKNVPEPLIEEQNTSSQAPALWHILKENRAFRRLTLAFVINGFANGLPATLFLLFVADRLGNRDAAGGLLVLYFTCGVLGVPFWLWLSKRVGKPRTWCLGMILAGVSFLSAVFLNTGDFVAFGVICILTGLALGADYVLPASLQADVIEADLQKHGKARAGQFLGVWTFASKLAFAAAVGLAFPVLSWSGYDPALNLKTDQGLMMLSLLYAGAPVLLKACAIAMMWRFDKA